MQILDVGATRVAHLLLFGIDLAQLNLVGTAETTNRVSTSTAMGPFLCIVQSKLLKMNATKVAVIVFSPLNEFIVPLFRKEADV